ncbi:MAG: nuclear transport factor 2 family protein [Acidimicrobiia bacterium]
MSVGTWESHHDITTLLYTYAEYIDAADFDAIGQLFEHGKITTKGMSGATEGREAVRDLYKNTNKVHEDGTLRTRHLCTNVIVDIDESAGTATARSSFLVLQSTKNLPFQPVVAGRYRDRFERAAGKWRFAEREMSVEQVGDTREHLNFDLGAFIDRVVD